MASEQVVSDEGEVDDDVADFEGNRVWPIYQFGYCVFVIFSNLRINDFIIFHITENYFNNY